MFSFFKNLKAKSDAINTYCWDAMKCYLFLKDDLALEAMVASLVVMGNAQRSSMLLALEDFSGKISSQIAQIFPNERALQDEAHQRIANLNQAVALLRSKKWGLVDVANVKRQLALSDKTAEFALGRSDGEYFKRKYDYPEVLAES